MSDDLKLRTIHCPACSGVIEFPVGRNRTTCSYCGNEVLVDEAGWLGKLDDFELKMKNAECALENKEWEHALRLFEACLAINETDPRCYRGIIESRTRGLTAGFNQKTESLYHCYINRANTAADPSFVSRYKEFLRKCADNDASEAASNAKENIEYFRRVIELKKERITDHETKIQDLKDKPGIDIAERKYGSAKAGLIFSTVMLILSPVISAGLIILAVYLVVRCFSGDVHLVGIAASLVGAIIFAVVTRFVWKTYRGQIQRVKNTRVLKLQEDHTNEEKEKNQSKQIDYFNSDIGQTAKDIEDLEQAITEQNEYLAIDRDLRIAYFEKLRFDDAGISNDIVVDPSILKFCEMERSKQLSGYRSLTKVKR